MRVIASDKDGYFAKGEEIDGATVYRGRFEVRDGNKVVEVCEAAIIEEDGESVRFEFAFGPTANNGIDHAREERLQGDYALAFAELVAAAHERLRCHGGSRRSDRESDLSIDLQL